MKPEIAKHWKKAFENFDDAKLAFENGQLDSIIKEKLWASIVHGQAMTRHLRANGEESLIAASIAIESRSQLEQLSIKQAFEKVLKALREYRNLVPDEYNLPLPTGLQK